MLYYNIENDPYDGSNKRQHLLELIMLVRRALTLKALYEKMIAIVTLTCKRIIPNLIPGVTYYVLTRYVLHIQPMNLVDSHALTSQYGYKLSVIIGVTVMTVIGLVDMAMFGIAIISQQYVFWWLFQRKTKHDKRNPS